MSLSYIAGVRMHSSSRAVERVKLGGRRDQTDHAGAGGIDDCHVWSLPIHTGPFHHSAEPSGAQQPQNDHK